MNSPLVSIIVINYNYERFLAEAIDSALGQSYPAVEVIVVDDGSTDKSRQMIASYGDRIASVFKENGGQFSALNAGFAASRGDIICLLDADDAFVEHKVARIVPIFTSDTAIGWCCHPLLLVDKFTDKVVGKTRTFPRSRQLTENKSDFRAALQRGKLPFYPSPSSGLCFRRSLLEQIYPLPVTFIKTSVDRYVRCAAVSLSPGFILTEALTRQGLHDRNAATTKNHKQKLNEREIVIAYLLRDRFPHLAKFTNRMFARGLSAYWKLDKADSEYGRYIRQYLADVRWIAKLEIVLLLLYQNSFLKRKYSHDLSEQNTPLEAQLRSPS